MSDVNGAAVEAREDYDPITFSVILSRFDAIVEEMTRVLEKSAWTSILALAHDYSCAIYDAVPRQVSMYDALPIHTASLHIAVKEIAEAFEGEIDPGDVFLFNDPYSGNTHVGDFVTAAPVFADGKLVFWSVTKGHQMDTGAYIPSSVVASAADIYQEGITIPPMKMVEAGKLRVDFFRLLLANLRYADLIEGDLRAQIGSIEKARQRLEELCESYGTDVVLRYVDEIISYSDRRAGQEIASMPDGRYEAEGWIDSDGFGSEHIRVQVAVEIDGDRVRVDYAGSDPQAKGGANGSYATSQAAGAVPFLYYIDADIPHNHGVIDHIDVSAEEGTVCFAKFPASTSVATIVPSDLMQDVVNRAMVEAMPERVPAGGARCANIPQFAGNGADGHSPWGFMLFNNAGAGGAAKGNDGWPLWYNQAALGGMKIQPIEQLELLYPVRIERCEIDTDSVGFGQWLGGPGNVCAVKPLLDEMVTITFGDAASNPPHGAMGGGQGSRRRPVRRGRGAGDETLRLLQRRLHRRPHPRGLRRRLHRRRRLGQPVRARGREGAARRPRRDRQPRGRGRGLRRRPLRRRRPGDRRRRHDPAARRAGQGAERGGHADRAERLALAEGPDARRRHLRARPAALARRRARRKENTR